MMLQTACCSRPGGRQENQDSYTIAEKDGAFCLVVADGVGGRRNGRYASQLATDAIRQSFLAEPDPTPETLRRHMEAAAQQISAASLEDPALRGMCTTLSAVYLGCHGIAAGHVGDSRIYILHNHKILYCSRDHSIVMQMVQEGRLQPEEIRGHPKRNVITAALGGSFPRQMDVVSFPHFQSGREGILLCSDGFWELILEDEMLDLMAKSQTAQQWLDRMEQLVGNRLSEHSDNYTCLVALRG